MKKILTLILIAFTFVGCAKLEQEPEAVMSKNAVFENEAGVALYANSFYNLLPNANAIMRSGNDEMSDMIARNNPPNFLRPGAFGPQQGSGWIWNDLRNINSFIQNLNNSSLSADVKNNYTGLAKFFRALFYFDKVVMFGDVPWVSRALDMNDPDLYKGRDSRFAVMDSVLLDLNFAIQHIALTQDNSRTLITKNIAKALKSRICLFEGTFRKYHTTYGKASTAESWLREAADAAGSIITDGAFSLNQGDKAYRNLFITKSPIASEVMLTNVYSTQLSLLHDANWYWTSATYGIRGSFTKTFINTYLNIDGTPFTNNPNYDQIVFTEETKGRDLRLAQTIRTKDYGRINANVFSLSPPLFSYTYTGYQPIKWVLDDRYYDTNSYNDNVTPIFRYAEILLNYAEAKAELGELNATDWAKTIGALRTRAGITNVALPTVADPYLKTNYFPEINDPILLEIRRERGIELVLEGFRFRDLIRWKKGDLLEMKWDGMYVPSLNTYMDLNEDGIPDVYFYKGQLSVNRITGVTYIDVSETIGSGQVNPFRLESENSGKIIWSNNIVRAWEDYKYFYPIPEPDRLQNPNLGQNPGWVN
jgi:hypothetical protein